MEIAFLIGLILGLTVGVLSRGINVNIQHGNTPKNSEIEYNDSVRDNSNPEINEWIDRHEGTGVK